MTRVYGRRLDHALLTYGVLCQVLQARPRTVHVTPGQVRSLAGVVPYARMKKPHYWTKWGLVIKDDASWGKEARV
jgi:hypothetical protein